MNGGYELMETEDGTPYDVSYNPDDGSDVILLDVDGPVHLTKSDLQTMLELL